MRAWLVDFLTAIVVAVISGGIVLVAGGPLWAFWATAVIVYLTRPKDRQMAERN